MASRTGHAHQDQGMFCTMAAFNTGAESEPESCKALLCIRVGPSAREDVSSFPQTCRMQTQKSK